MAQSVKSFMTFCLHPKDLTLEELLPEMTPEFRDELVKISTPFDFDRPRTESVCRQEIAVMGGDRDALIASIDWGLPAAAGRASTTQAPEEAKQKLLKFSPGWCGMCENNIKELRQWGILQGRQLNRFKHMPIVQQVYAKNRTLSDVDVFDDDITINRDACIKWENAIRERLISEQPCEVEAEHSLGPVTTDNSAIIRAIAQNFATDADTAHNPPHHYTIYFNKEQLDLYLSTAIPAP